MHLKKLFFLGVRKGKLNKSINQFLILYIIRQSRIRQYRPKIDSHLK